MLLRYPYYHCQLVAASCRGMVVLAGHVLPARLASKFKHSLLLYTVLLFSLSEMYIDQKIYKAKSININGKLFQFDEPKIMGIINLSHDSFYENDTNVTASYSITSGKNAMSAGPITLNANIIVTIPSGSVWTVV